MNKEKVIELVKILNNNDYRDVFGALMVFEKLDYLHSLEDFDNKDIEFLESVYNKFMDSPTCERLINEEINEFLESEEK